MEKTQVERLKQEFATKTDSTCCIFTEKMQHLSAKPQATSVSASCQLAESEDFLKRLRSKIFSVTAVRDKCYNRANEALKKLKTVEADVALQLSRREAALE